MADKTIQKPQNEDKIYRLEEMAESMRDSIKNAKEVLSQQELLLNIIQDSDNIKVARLNDFVKGLQNDMERMKYQIATMEKRKGAISAAILICKNESNANKAVNLLLAGLNVFPDAPTE